MKKIQYTSGKQSAWSAVYSWLGLRPTDAEGRIDVQNLVSGDAYARWLDPYRIWQDDGFAVIRGKGYGRIRITDRHFKPLFEARYPLA